jgi:hypothetical protein
LVAISIDVAEIWILAVRLVLKSMYHALVLCFLDSGGGYGISLCVLAFEMPTKDDDDDDQEDVAAHVTRKVLESAVSPRSGLWHGLTLRRR